jgi:Flp pilus assembly protein TadB
MMTVNADYFSILTDHPLGKTLLFLALCGQALAFAVIRKIVDIRI